MTGPLLITGASGWFGRTALWEYEQEYGPEALRRDVIPFASRERWIYFDSPHGPVKALPLEAINNVENPRGLLHLAFLTRDKVEELGWQCYVDTNRRITKTIAGLLSIWPMMPIICTSSGAAALGNKRSCLENNPYAFLKLEEENMLRACSYGRMTTVFRVYAATGQFMTRREKFALGSFLNQVLQDGVVKVYAKNLVKRSYVHAGSLFRLSLRMLAVPLVSGFYCIDACMETMDIRALAARVGHLFCVPVVSPPADSLLTPSVYTGSDFEFRKLLSAYSLIPPSIDMQIYETMRNSASSSE